MSDDARLRCKFLSPDGLYGCELQKGHLGDTDVYGLHRHGQLEWTCWSGGNVEYAPAPPGALPPGYKPPIRWEPPDPGPRFHLVDTRSATRDDPAGDAAWDALLEALRAIFKPDGS